MTEPPPATPLSPYAAAWNGVSRVADIGGPVHYVDFGGRVDGPCIVLVHGLGGSHLNWCLLAPRLARHARVVAVDLAGFGLTHPAGRAVTVPANAGLLGRFVGAVAGGPVVLVGNSMGGMVSILLASARPEVADGVVLVDPALPWVRGVRPDRLVAAAFLLYALPRVGERYLARRRATLSSRQLVQQVLTLCCVDPSVVPEELVAASVALLDQRAAVPGLDAAFLSAARSLVQVNARRRQYQAAMRAIRAPVLLLHGEQDRLVPVHAAQAAAAHNPSWRFQPLRGVGHVPQLETPDTVADLVLDWLGSTGVASAAARSVTGSG